MHEQARQRQHLALLHNSGMSLARAVQVRTVTSPDSQTLVADGGKVQGLRSRQPRCPRGTWQTRVSAGGVVLPQRPGTAPGRRSAHLINRHPYANLSSSAVGSKSLFFGGTVP